MSLQRWAYTLLLGALLPAACLRLWWRGLRDRGYRQRWRERFGHIHPGPARGGRIWIHAVSVGEVQAARPLIDALSRERPDCEFVVSTTTPSGARILRSQVGEVVAHYYFPIDLPVILGRYLDALQPELLLLVETELWPNLIAACAERGVAVALVNARMSARSARGYRLAAGLTAETLGRCALIAAQTTADAERLAALGAPAERCRVTGSIKFDVRIPASIIEQGRALRARIGTHRPVLAAASTHAGEEEAVLAAFAGLRRRWPELLLILVPRHPERAAAVFEQVRRSGYRAARRSTRGAALEVLEVYVGDTMGELTALYAAADLAFVGGSLVDLGGHNLLEPAALGLPVLSGPSLFNFEEIGGHLRACGALQVVGDAAALESAVAVLLGDANLRARRGDAGRGFVEANRGAAEGLLAGLRPLLPGHA